MKKVLFATSALVAAGSMAYADGHTGINFGGSAEIGIAMVDTDAAASPNDGDFRFHHDMDLDITFSGALDNGLTFGADIDLDEVSNGISNNDGPHTVFLSGSFGTITMGDTDGAFDKALTEVAVGSTIADDPEHGGWSGNSGLDGLYDGQIARYDYSFGSLTLSFSAELDDTDETDVLDTGGGATALSAGVDGDPVIGIGAAWTGDLGGVSLGVGVGYQTVDVDAGTSIGNGLTPNDPSDDAEAAIAGIAGDHSISGVSLKAGFGAVTAIVNYTTEDRPAGFALGETDYTAISLEYTTGDLTLGANYGENDNSVSGATDGFGVWVTYGLADGIDFVAGYATSETDAGVQTDRASIGLGLSF